MQKDRNKPRREFLSKFGWGLLGIFGGAAASGTAAAAAPAGVFASSFLKNRNPHVLPPGHYDPNTQLFRETATNEAMFVEETGDPPVPLSQEQLAELLENGRFVDISRFPKVKIAASTRCTESSLRTTHCCPIQTDSRNDRVQDD